MAALLAAYHVFARHPVELDYLTLALEGFRGPCQAFGTQGKTSSVPFTGGTSAAKFWRLSGR